MVWRAYMLCMLCCAVAVFGLLSVGHGAPGEAFGPCEPGFVQYRRDSLPIMLAATPGLGTEQAGEATLEWLGHSSFLLTSPEGLRILTDPNGYHAIATPHAGFERGLGGAVHRGARGAPARRALVRRRPR